MRHGADQASAIRPVFPGKTQALLDSKQGLILRILTTVTFQAISLLGLVGSVAERIWNEMRINNGRLLFFLSLGGLSVFWYTIHSRQGEHLPT